MLSIDSFERRVQNYCTMISNNSPEFWEERNKAILGLISLVDDCEKNSASNINVTEYFNIKMFRLLKEPLKSMITDLRSQQVRDTCTFISVLSAACGDHIKFLMKEIFQTILDALKVQNRVMSGYIDDCICSLLRNSTLKLAIPLLINEFKDCKAKHVREKCLGHINTILELWELNDKEVDLLQDVIRIGLVDASVRSREIARCCYLNFRSRFPSHVDWIKSKVSPSLLERLIRLENEFDAEDNDITTTNDDGMTIVNEKENKKVKARRLSVWGGDEGEGEGDGTDSSFEAFEPLEPLGEMTSELSSSNIDLSLDIEDKNIISMRKINISTATNSDTYNYSNGNTGNGVSVERIDDHIASEQLKVVEPTTRSSSTSSSSSSSNSNRFAQANPALKVGQRVKIVGDVLKSQQKKEKIVTGIIKFIGLTSFSDGNWVGVHLDKAIGKNDGSVQSLRYFSCPANHGIFVRPNLVHPTNSYSMNKDKDVNLNETLLHMKLKVSKAMDILNQQLEIVEHIDNVINDDENGHNGINKSSKTNITNIEEYKSLIEEMKELNVREVQLCQDFQNKL